MSTTKMKHGTWVVVMDGEKALFLRNDGDSLNPNLQVFREETQDNPATGAQGAERPGRLADGPGEHKSAVQETDWHRLAKEDFAREIASRLYRDAHRGRFESLVLVAPPQVLGEVRKDLHKEVRDRVIAELAKDLTGHPVFKIEEIIAGA
ncbi:MAG: host attachment family protein [Alphaproteobacteria bacterium]